MRGNIVTELRNFVETAYAEGLNEIFSFSIIDGKDGIEVEVADFNLDFAKLPDTYANAYRVADTCMQLAKSRYSDCKSINALICDEVKEEVVYMKPLLRVFNLNVPLKEG